MSINERLNPPLWIEQLGITPLPTIYGWADAETGEMLYRVKDIPNPDLSYIFNAKQRKILESGGLLLVPMNAVESVDGEYQRFEPIDAWFAQLAMEDWRSALIVQFKVPALATSYQVLMISFMSGDITDLGLKLSCQITNGSVSFGVFGGISTTYSAAQPAPDTVITLTITKQSATLAYGEVSETIDISTDNLAVPFNCAASSSGFEGDAVLPLSIKVSALDQA